LLGPQGRKRHARDDAAVRQHGCIPLLVLLAGDKPVLTTIALAP
jgi:hypothetical protein